MKKLISLCFIAISVVISPTAHAEQGEEILKKDEYLILQSALCNSEDLTEDEVADNVFDEALGKLPFERVEELEVLAIEMLDLSSDEKTEFCQRI